MQVQVPYTAIEYRYFKSGTTLRYCAATGLFEEHDNEVCTIHNAGLRYSQELEPSPAVILPTMPTDSNWPNDEDF